MGLFLLTQPSIIYPILLLRKRKRLFMGKPQCILLRLPFLYLATIMKTTMRKKCFTFPFRLFVPNSSRTMLPPVFLLICNRSEDEIDPHRKTFSEYWPVDDIIDNGFATAAYWSGDIDPDDSNDDFTINGIHPLLDGGTRTDSSWGAIAAWAWGASRILDVLVREEQEFHIDSTKVVMIGHSRGGKTALWATVEHERLAMAASNNSGCTGAALSKRKACGKVGETIAQINEVFPNWFCKNYRRYNNNEMAMEVDQHMLLACIAPRAVSVASATKDDWADPIGEYLSTRDASIVWSKVFGIHSKLPNQQPPPEEPIQSGNLGYHLRSGEHDLNRYDWQQHMTMAKRVFGDAIE